MSRDKGNADRTDGNQDLELFRKAVQASPLGILMRTGDAVVYSNPAWDAAECAALVRKAEDVVRYAIEHNGAAVEVEIAEVAKTRTQLEPELRERQRLEELGRWVGGVVHDFNNLLTAVMLYSDLLNETLPAGSTQLAYNHEVRQAAQRGAELISQLLGFARERAPEPEVISLNALIRGAKGLLQRLVGEGIELTLELSDSPCNVNINPSQMEQVLFNLVLNSRDAMAGKGTLTVRTAEEETGAEAQAVLVVSDTGCGMDAATMSHMFEPFFTTKKKGSGLGLSTVQSIVSRNGGTISVRSASGEGTTIMVALPRAESGEAEDGAQVEASDLAKGNETVLLVEDDAAVRSSIRRLLGQCGYQVLEADSGPDAIRAATEFSGTIDLLLTDIALPGYSGRVLASRMRAAGHSMRVLFMSGYCDLLKDSDFDECMVLRKPFDKEILAERVRQCLDSGTPVSN